MTRTEALQAMESQSIFLKSEATKASGAMPKPLREPTELGCIGRRGGQFRAEFSAWDSGRELRFEGPYRDDEDFAQDDLLTIRAAARG